MQKPVRVSIAVFPESDPSIFFGVFDTLWAAGRLWNELCRLPPCEALFAPRIVGACRGALQLVTGVSIQTQAAASEVEGTDVVFVPNVMVTNATSLHALDRRLVDWIRSMYESGAHLYSACGGSLVLAEAGLLNGLEATTHWGYAPLFASEYPQVRLRMNRIVVQTGLDRRIVCGGGASSWQDLVLFLVARHAGAEEAVKLAKIFLYQWHADGQLPYACLIQNTAHDDCVIADQQAWLARHCAQSKIVRAAVRRSGLSERSLARRFKAATGYTPMAYVQALRIEHAKKLLEDTVRPVEEIGCEVGYQDPVSFRRLFKRLSGITPGEYRRKYRIPQQHVSH